MLPRPPARRLRPTRFLAVAGLAACASPPTSSSWVDPAADDDWSSLVETYEHQAEWSAEEVAAQIEAGLSAGLPQPAEVFDRFDELMTHTDDSCPGSTFNGGFLLVGICTTEEGYQFSGAAGLTGEDNRIYDEEGGWSGEATRMSSPFDYMIVRPDGTRLNAGGNVTQWVSADPGQERWSAEVSGTFKDDGATGWLADGYSGALRVSGQEDAGGISGEIDGYLTLQGVSLQLQGLWFSPETCPDGPTQGMIKLRQHDSTWYTLRLTGPCGGCGELVWDDTEPMGEVCADLSPLVTGLMDAAAW